MPSLTTFSRSQLSPPGHLIPIQSTPLVIMEISHVRHRYIKDEIKGSLLGPPTTLSGSPEHIGLTKKTIKGLFDHWTQLFISSLRKDYTLIPLILMDSSVPQFSLKLQSAEYQFLNSLTAFLIPLKVFGADSQANLQKSMEATSGDFAGISLKVMVVTPVFFLPFSRKMFRMLRQHDWMPYPCGILTLLLFGSK